MMNTNIKAVCYVGSIVFLGIIFLFSPVFAQYDRSGTLWSPFIEWNIQNSSYTGNPFDIIATVTFTHTNSGNMHITQMFYDGNNVWKFRFTGTRTGEWAFISASADPELDGISGTVNIEPNSDPEERGFVVSDSNRWVRSGTGNVYVPQFVMYLDPYSLYQDTSRIDNDIHQFFDVHGFNGFHLHSIAAGWFEIERSGEIGGMQNIVNYDPDIRTFRILEILIQKVYDAGGHLHFWIWGDHQRNQTPRDLPGGINGVEDKRLQRCIAARLGPIPGWTAEYGFDNWEWSDGSQHEEWHSFMHLHFGWPHLLGVRWQKNQLTQSTEVLDYASYEWHEPTYQDYVDHIEARPDKPAFSEDRFRMRNGGAGKDYTMEQTRRGLWHSTMAGGVANIWGQIESGSPSPPGTPSGGLASGPYPNPEMIKTYSEFFKSRFIRGLIRDNTITDGICLRDKNRMNYIFYKENASSIQMDLTNMSGSQPAIAVDTKLNYSEINVGLLNPTSQSWTAPYSSDWAIAVGDFETPTIVPDPGRKDLPQGFKLYQNYPNPFNSMTKITFYLRKTDQVSLKVFNVRGELVATILDDTLLNTGEYEVGFDGSKLSSGILYYRLRNSSNFQEIRKMVLLK